MHNSIEVWAHNEDSIWSLIQYAIRSRPRDQWTQILNALEKKVVGSRKHMWFFYSTETTNENEWSNKIVKLESSIEAWAHNEEDSIESLIL